jgi:hypothetical protein
MKYLRMYVCVYVCLCVCVCVCLCVCREREREIVDIYKSMLLFLLLIELNVKGDIFSISPSIYLVKGEIVCERVCVCVSISTLCHIVVTDHIT